jgi:hypothetical protein
MDSIELSNIFSILELGLSAVRNGWTELWSGEHTSWISHRMRRRIDSLTEACKYGTAETSTSSSETEEKNLEKTWVGKPISDPLAYKLDCSIDGRTACALAF